jgi:hypothetical protein
MINHNSVIDGFPDPLIRLQQAQLCKHGFWGTNMSKRIFIAAAGAAALLATAGVASAQNVPAPGAVSAQQAQTDNLAEAIKTQIAMLGANPTSADVQAAIAMVVGNSGATPAVAYAAVRAVALTSTSASVQAAATASASVVLASAGTPAAQAQVQTQASTLTAGATQALATTTTTGTGNNAIASASGLSGGAAGSTVAAGGLAAVSGLSIGAIGAIGVASASAVGVSNVAASVASTSTGSSGYR